MSTDSNVVDFDISDIKVEPVFFPDDLIESDDGNSNLEPDETSSSGEMKNAPPVQDSPQVETESAPPKKTWEGMVTDDPPKSDRRYTCLRCGFVTEIDDELRDHMVRQHAEIIRAEGPPKNSKLPYVTIPRRFICSICRKLLDSSTALAEHLKTHEGPKVKADGKKVLRCDKCSFVTPSMKKFRKHTMRFHTGERPFKCDKCNYAAIDSAGLRKHVYRTHKRETPSSTGTSGTEELPLRTEAPSGVHSLSVYIPRELCGSTGTRGIEISRRGKGFSSHLTRHREKAERERESSGTDTPRKKIVTKGTVMITGDI